MEIKQIHVISSSGGEKMKRVGEGEKSSKARRRRDGGNHGYKARMEGKMMHSQDLRGVRTEHGHGGMNSRVTQTVRRQITCSRRATDVMAWCVGRT